MIIEANTILKSASFPEVQLWEDDKRVCGWIGLLFLPGVLAGPQSLEKFFNRCDEVGLEVAAPEMKGVYFLVIQDKATRRLTAFCDTSGTYKAFYSSRALSTSFLNLAKALKFSRQSVSAEAAAEFLHIGGIFFDRTFLPGIRKIAWDEIVAFDDAGNVTRSKKVVSRLGTKQDFSVREFFQNIVRSLDAQRLSLDLTGGFDSRLMVCLFDSCGATFETAISGLPGSADISIAQRIARQLKRNCFVTYHNTNSLDVEGLFEISDGLGDPLAYHRLAEMYKARRARGITTAIPGIGGELYRDFWWLQDFPFYRLKRARLGRLYDLRIAAIPFPHDWLSGALRDASLGLRSRMVRGLELFQGKLNTNVYDQVYYDFKMKEIPARFITNATNHFLPVYTPFLDRDLVGYGYDLPRRYRFFNRFDRSLITELNPAVAALKTTEGLTASATPFALPLDCGRYAANKAWRLQRKIFQRTLRWTLPSESPNAPELFSSFRESPLFAELARELCQRGLFAGGFVPQTIHPRWVGRVVALGLLMRHLNSS